ncbi:MAG: hypothetical protein Q8876_08750, partial [Bacillota bacterium]|nr:hypothetical protein [Bacillota bacterium]
MLFLLYGEKLQKVEIKTKKRLRFYILTTLFFVGIKAKPLLQKRFLSSRCSLYTRLVEARGID